MKKFWKKTEGFTLVELVVVIAILGILAGVGTVGYSGYVKKANMAADQQLARDIELAVNLEYINNPGAMSSGTHYVVLSKTAAQNPSAGIVADAIKNSFGENAVLKLQHDWGDRSGAVVNHFDDLSKDTTLGVLFTDTDGDGKVDAAPSFAADVDTLFDVIKTTAIDVAGNSSSGAELVKGAAVTTMEGTTAAAFAQNWTKAEKWDSSFIMDTGTYDDSSIDANKDNEAFMNNAVANAAIIKARNTSFATYLRNTNPTIGNIIYNDLANYTYGASSIVPKDIGEVTAKALSNELAAKHPELTNTAIRDAINNAKTDYYAAGGPAYNDALAYYTMMSTVDKVTPDKVDDDSYWDQMKTSVSLYGSIATGNTSVSDFNSMKTAVGSGDGVMCRFTVKDGKVVGDGMIF